MDDCCAVCAEPLEWVAYGPCGHREVCSTCVVRLRFVLDDPRCCLCKSPSPSVFVTKAMGDYTKVLADFSALPQSPLEGRVGAYWYHEDSQAYFDDADHYRMVRAMCRLSCSACGEDQDGGRRRPAVFRNIQQLKGHLFHNHRLFMCTLCLEGRKVFICEQKLYTKSQLNQHINTGDSEVDGSESERGGFSGHPKCEFCRSPFYGDNELYMHMSRDHYTCHICQRRNPGQYDYFKNYDDLEIHFRQEHFICEDEACLAEKFVVFQSESELKRHNALRHGGNISRAKRNAALAIPTSFRFRPTNGQERRGRTYYTNLPEEAFAFGRPSSSLMSNAHSRNHDSSSSGPNVSEYREGNQLDTITALNSLNMTPNVQSSSRLQTTDRPIDVVDRQVNAVLLEESGFPALSEREAPETSLRYVTAVNTGALSNLGEAAFPPLPGASVSNLPEHQIPSKSFAAHAKKSSQRKSISKPEENHRNESSITGSSSQAWPSIQTSVSSSSGSTPTTMGNIKPNIASTHVKVSSGDRWSSLPNSISKANKLNHSSSAPDLVSGGHSQPTGDIHAANKSLVEKIQAALGMDDDRFAAFKSISSEYRQGLIGAVEYVSYAQQFGLSHLIVDLAQLCPDSRKQKELIDIYKANLQNKQTTESAQNASSSRERGNSKKQKGKAVDISESTSATAKLSDDILKTVKKLQENIRQQDGRDVELLSKDGYRTAKGRSISAPGRELSHADSSPTPQKANGTASGQDPGGTNNKPRKKTSKFHRVRLGDGSAAALYDLGSRDATPDCPDESSSSKGNGLPARGVWKNGGGQKLFGASSKGP